MQTERINVQSRVTSLFRLADFVVCRVLDRTLGASSIARRDSITSRSSECHVLCVVVQKFRATVSNYSEWRSVPNASINTAFWFVVDELGVHFVVFFSMRINTDVL